MENQIKVPQELKDLPDEVLLLMMGFLNDTTLLDMTGVCKRFKAIAKEVFTKKYSGTSKDDYYKLNIYPANLIEQHKQYRPFFIMFGEDIIAIRIEFCEESRVANDHWFIDLIKKHCEKLAKISIWCGKCVDLTWLPKPTLTHLCLNYCTLRNHSWTSYRYPKLIYFSRNELDGKQRFEEFIDNNGQLQELRLEGEYLYINILHSISGKLNDLKSLYIQTYNSSAFSERIVQLPKLEDLKLYHDAATGDDTTDDDTNGDDYTDGDKTDASILRSLSTGCKNITSFDFSGSQYCIPWDDEKINALCGFKQLESLKLSASIIKIAHIKRIIQELVSLTSLYLIHINEEMIDHVFDVISICSKLKNLAISFCKGDNSIMLKHDFIIRLAATTVHKLGIKITLKRNFKTKDMIFSQGEVRCGNSIVYWSGYDPIHNQTDLTLLSLGKACMEKIFDYLNMNDQSALYNTCMQTQKFVADYVSNTAFHVSDLYEGIDEHAFECLVPIVRHMIVDCKISLQQWKFISRYGTKLIELNVTHREPSTLQRANISLPNLKKLTFFAIDFEGLRSINCPLLTYFAVSNFNKQSITITAARTFHIGDSSRNLTVLKVIEVITFCAFRFNCFSLFFLQFDLINDGVVKFLTGLDEHICNQLIELSLGKSTSVEESTIKTVDDRLLKIVNVIAQCRNLNILRLIIANIEKMNSKILFEHCTKLTDFTIYCSDYYYRSGNMFDCLRANCKNIKSIQIVIADSKKHAFVLKFLHRIIVEFPNASVSLIDKNITFPDIRRFLHGNEDVI